MYDLNSSDKKQAVPSPVNRTGIPSQLKENIEQSHRLSLDDVRIHYNSEKPKQLHAHAYTQGRHVYISPGQEKHLPHELGHVIQQMSKKVRPTLQVKGVNINNDPALEREADLLGSCLMCTGRSTTEGIQQDNVAQCYFYDDADIERVEKLLMKKIDTLINIKVHDTNFPQQLKECNDALIEHGIISGHVEVSGHDSTYILYESDSPQLFSSTKSLCDFLKPRIASLKSHMEEESEAERSQILAGVPFGNEFTFRIKHPDFEFNVQELSVKNNAKVTKAGALINSLAKDAPGTISMNHIVLYKKIECGNKKWSDATYEAARITYAGYDRENDENISWSFNIDLDPNCIEIQTQPITYAAFQNLMPLFDSAIFSTAGKLGLIADANPDTGGGGHISLDKTGAFKNNAHYLRNFLVLYANEQFKPESWVHDCKDSINAPFLCELGPKVVDKFNAAISDFDHLPPEEQTIDALVNNIQQKVYSGQFTKRLAEALMAQESLKKLPLEYAYHYQAVNLEHMLRPDNAAHIEMRRYNAQQNVYELATQLEQLWELLLLSRKKENIPFGPLHK